MDEDHTINLKTKILMSIGGVTFEVPDRCIQVVDEDGNIIEPPKEPPTLDVISSDAEVTEPRKPAFKVIRGGKED